MADIAIIIGNGFDLDMGLPTKYSDFINSLEWQNIITKVDAFLQDKNYKEHSLVGQLQLASKDSQWFDIEEEIHKFIAAHPDNTPQTIGEIKYEFELIRRGLANYLKSVATNRIQNKDKLSYLLLYNLQQSPYSIVEIYFNYTNPGNFMPHTMYYSLCKFTYVHGSLQNDDIVLGCDLHSGEKVNRQLSFMYKYNMLNRANHVALHLLEAKEIIFFGHSVNEMDFCYFREFFKVASASPKPFRHLTFITYDEQSERNIKDNIRNQGISVTDLYNNLITFTFIHTKRVYEGDVEESKNWTMLLQRLLTTDRNGF